MSAAAVTTSGLVKTYGDTVALSGVGLEVNVGSVYGLAGPNGAGKTTLLGLLAGLRKPTEGSVELSSSRVAVLPDTPRFDGWMTAREVVELARVLATPVVAAEATDEMLAVAGLSDVADRRVKGFSRGMLQRLGLAASVVGNPELLLLDEPAAALDPAGRREVLDLITELRGRATVLFSSHILDDVQEVCDHVGILNRGELVYQGTLEGIVGDAAAGAYVIETRHDTTAVVSALTGRSWVADVTSYDASVRIEVTSLDEAERELVPTLAGVGVPIVAITPERATLEKVFLELTQ